MTNKTNIDMVSRRLSAQGINLNDVKNIIKKEYKNEKKIIEIKLKEGEHTNIKMSNDYMLSVITTPNYYDNTHKYAVSGIINAAVDFKLDYCDKKSPAEVEEKIKAAKAWLNEVGNGASIVMFYSDAEENIMNEFAKKDGDWYKVWTVDSSIAKKPIKFNENLLSVKTGVSVPDIKFLIEYFKNELVV